MSRFFSVVCLIGALAVSAPAFAVPITFTQTSVVSGSIGLTSFTNATVTITQVTDTSLTTFNSGLQYYDNAGGLRTVTISGVGTASFLSGTIGFSVSPSSMLEAFYDPATGFNYGEKNSAFGSYNLAGATSPITGTESGGLAPENFANTSLGALSFTASSGPTFQATLTGAPAPEIDPSLAAAGLTLISGGIAVLRGGRVRRRFGAGSGC